MGDLELDDLHFDLLDDLQSQSGDVASDSPGAISAPNGGPANIEIDLGLDLLGSLEDPKSVASCSKPSHAKKAPDHVL